MASVCSGHVCLETCQDLIRGKSGEILEKSPPLACNNWLSWLSIHIVNTNTVLFLVLLSKTVLNDFALTSIPEHKIQHNNFCSIATFCRLTVSFLWKGFLKSENNYVCRWTLTRQKGWHWIRDFVKSRRWWQCSWKVNDIWDEDGILDVLCELAQQ